MSDKHEQIGPARYDMRMRARPKFFGEVICPETGFSVVLLVPVLLFYLSSPHNKVHKWCFIANILF